SPIAVYCSTATAYLIGLALPAAIRLDSAASLRRAASSQMVLEGLRFISRNKLILGAISLDLFAVLLGGAVALLPVYAHEILNVGAAGLGLLRSAPALGGVLMALVLAHWPLKRRAGAALLWCVTCFG